MYLRRFWTGIFLNGQTGIWVITPKLRPSREVQWRHMAWLLLLVADWSTSTTLAMPGIYRFRRLPAAPPLRRPAFKETISPMLKLLKNKQKKNGNETL